MNPGGKDLQMSTKPDESIRTHSTPDPETPPPKPVPVPDDVPEPEHAPVKEPREPGQAPVKMR